jgi:hypothetical protein
MHHIAHHSLSRHASRLASVAATSYSRIGPSCQWIRRYILFFDKRHPLEMGEGEINTFLSYLATKGEVAASTQNQALSALLFLYRDVLGRGVGQL